MIPEVYAVARARFWERFLAKPETLEKIFSTRSRKEIENIVFSLPVSQFINEKEAVSSIDGFIKEKGKEFADLLGGGGDFVKFICGKSITTEKFLSSQSDPLKVYDFFWKQRLKYLGRIDGWEVPAFVWASMLWQMRILRAAVFCASKDIPLVKND